MSLTPDQQLTKPPQEDELRPAGAPAGAPADRAEKHTEPAAEEHQSPAVKELERPEVELLVSFKILQSSSLSF